MKRISPIFLVILLGFAITSCQSPEEKAQQHISRGNDFFAQNDLKKARLEFKSALQINNNLPEAWYGLSRIFEKNKDWRQQFVTLKKIKEVNPEFFKARVKYGQLLLASNQLDEALQEARELSEQFPDKAETYSLMAATQYRIGNLDQALKMIDQSLEIQPESEEALLIKAKLLFEQNSIPTALDLVEKAISINPEYVSAYLLQIDFLTRLGNETEIPAIFEILIRKFPENPAYSVSLAKYYETQKNFKDSKALYLQLINRFPEQWKFKEMLLDFSISHFPVDENIQLINDLLQKGKNEQKLKLVLGELYTNSNNLLEAEKTYQDLINTEKNNAFGLEARNQLASLYLKSGKYNEALALSKEVLDVDEENEGALLIKSAYAIYEQSIENALIDLRTVIRNNPDSATAHVLLGQVYKLNGSDALFLESYQKAFDLDPSNPLVANTLASIALQSQDLTRADTILKTSFDSGNHSVKSLALYARVKLQQNDWESAEKVAELLSRNQDTKALSEQISGFIFQGKQDTDASIEAFKRAYDLSPDSSQPVITLVRSYLNSGKIAEAKKFLDSNPDNVLALFLKSQVFLFEDNSEEAINALNKAKEINPLLVSPYTVLADIYLAQGEKNNAIEVLDEGIATSEQKLELYLKKARIYLDEKDYDDARITYAAALKRYPDNQVIKNNYASFLTDYSEAPEDLELALQLSKDFYNSKVAFFRDTYGWALIRSGTDLQKALSLLLELDEGEGTPAVFYYHIAVAFEKVGNMTSSIKYYKLAQQAASQGFPYMNELSEKLRDLDS